MGNIKIANDVKVLAGSDIKEKVLYEQRIDKKTDGSSYQGIYNIPSGVNRINLYCEEEATFDVRIWQYLETLQSKNFSSSVFTSSKYYKSAMNTHGLVALYGGTPPTPSATSTNLKHEDLTYTDPLNAAFGYVVTSDTSYLKIHADISSDIDMSAYIFYNFTTSKLATSLPLFPAYPAGDDGGSYPRGIYIDINSSADLPIILQLTEEEGRTAAADVT